VQVERLNGASAALPKKWGKDTVESDESYHMRVYEMLNKKVEWGRNILHSKALGQDEIMIVPIKPQTEIWRHKCD
jgi:hypothetical protein